MPYEALTGQPPFRLQAAQAVIAAHLNGPIPQPSAANPAVPRALDAVIARGMAKEPDDRYGSTGALARAASRALTPTQSFFDPPSGTFCATVIPWASAALRAIIVPNGRSRCRPPLRARGRLPLW